MKNNKHGDAVTTCVCSNGKSCSYCRIIIVDADDDASVAACVSDNAAVAAAAAAAACVPVNAAAGL